VREFWPWPTVFGGVKELAIQKRDDELFQERPELKFGFKKVLLVEGTANTRTLVRLSKVSLGNWVYSLYIERRQL